MDEYQLQQLERRIAALEARPSMPDHRHNGFDVSRTVWEEIARKKFYIHHTIAGTAAATAANYGVFWIAPYACHVDSFKEVHQTAGSNGGAVTLTLEKLTGTQAPDGGVVMLASTLSLKATANTVQSGSMTTTLANRNLVQGDRLCLKDSGTLTDVANVTVMVEITII